jgi:hypothetical protein
VKKGRRRWGRIILALLFLVAVIYGGWWAFTSRWKLQPPPCCGAPGQSPPTAPTTEVALDARAPAGVRIKVEVLNTTTTRGLARRATLFLRDRGFDVVGTGTVRATRDSTLVLDRSGHPDWARLVAKALNARMESRPDSSRFLDVTVLLGGNWRPPALPFYP